MLEDLRRLCLDEDVLQLLVLTDGHGEDEREVEVLLEVEVVEGAQGLEQEMATETFSRANLPSPVALWFAATVMVAKIYARPRVFPSHVQTLPSAKAHHCWHNPTPSTDLCN